MRGGIISMTGPGISLQIGIFVRMRKMNSNAGHSLQMGEWYPYDGCNDGTSSGIRVDWAVKAARGVIADLLSRNLDLDVSSEDIRAEIIESLGDVIRLARENDLEELYG